MENFSFYAWIFLPLLIFLSRVADVSLGTVRVIFISKGMKRLASTVGFFEVLIWLLAIGQIMNNLNNPICYLAYGGGFAMGNFVGIWIAGKLSLGVVMLRVVTVKDAQLLVDSLSESEYGVTSVDGQGKNGPVKIIFTIVPRREVANIITKVKAFNPKAFYSIEEVGYVDQGIFPSKNGTGFRLKGIIRPFRKGK